MGYQHKGYHGRKGCGCGPRRKEVVYPTKECVMHCCSEEVVRHIHPTHTTVVNNHLIRNEHVYPHSVSNVNKVNETNVHGQRPTRPSCPRGSRPSGYDPSYGVQGSYGGHKKECCPRPRPCQKKKWC